MTETQVKIRVTQEDYVDRCNKILEDPKLGDLEKMMALMGYANKVKIVTDLEQAMYENKNPFSRPSI